MSFITHRQCPYAEDSPCDLQLDMDMDTDADKIDDLEHIVPAGSGSLAGAGLGGGGGVAGHQRHRRKHR